MRYLQLLVLLALSCSMNSPPFEWAGGSAGVEVVLPTKDAPASAEVSFEAKGRIFGHGIQVRAAYGTEGHVKACAQLEGFFSWVCVERES